MINIGKVIYNRIHDLVDGKCYPLVADLTTKYPFIIYEKTTSFPTESKDSYCQYIHNITIRIVDDKYDKAVALSEECMTRLVESEGMIIEDIEILEVTLDSISEEYIDNAFVQIINIEIKTN